MGRESMMRRQEPLRRHQILDTAIALADEEGIKAVSMRRLGSALGVEAMSLYNHIEDKQDLLNGMAGRLLSLMEFPSVELMGWQDAIRTVCRSYRQLAHAHPGIFPYVHSRPLKSPESLPPLEAVLAILTSEGFDANTALDAFQVSASYVAGFAMTEIGNGMIGVEDTAPWLGFPSSEQVKDDFPATANIIMTAVPDADRAFELGLDLLLHGLDRLPRMETEALPEPGRR